MPAREGEGETLFGQRCINYATEVKSGGHGWGKSVSGSRLVSRA